MINSNINDRSWFLFNVKNKILGRFVTRIVYFLIGKNRCDYYPYIDVGNYVIVINAKYIKVTGSKIKNKFYFSHSGYVGNLKKVSLGDLLNKCPEKVILNAVKGMLPKNNLRYLMLKRLKIYSGSFHKHLSSNIINIF